MSHAGEACAPVSIVPLTAWLFGGHALWFLGGSFLLWMALEYRHGEVAGQIRRLALNSAAEIGLRRLGPHDEALEWETPAPGPRAGMPEGVPSGMEADAPDAATPAEEAAPIGEGADAFRGRSESHAADKEASEDESPVGGA